MAVADRVGGGALAMVRAGTAVEAAAPVVGVAAGTDALEAVGAAGAGVEVAFAAGAAASAWLEAGQAPLVASISPWLRRDWTESAGTLSRWGGSCALPVGWQMTAS